MRHILAFGLLLGVFVGLAGCAGLPFFGHPRYVVFFRSFSTALDQPAREVIAAAARTARNNPVTRITVTGAADTVGTTPDNIRLSQERASAVAAALVDDGVSPGRVRAEGLGEMPSGAASEQESRRAIIHFGL